MNETKVSINDLISLASYSVEETTCPSYEELEEDFSDTWKDLYFDEDLKDAEGKHCYIVHDDCNYNIRAVVVSDELNNKTKISLIDIMDNVIWDLLYQDIIEQIEQLGYEYDTSNQAYDDLLKFVREHNILISDYEYSWLLILAEERLDLLTL